MISFPSLPLETPASTRRGPGCRLRRKSQSARGDWGCGVQTEIGLSRVLWSEHGVVMRYAMPGQCARQPLQSVATKMNCKDGKQAQGT
jgi:hypothetical protein